MRYCQKGRGGVEWWRIITFYSFLFAVFNAEVSKVRALSGTLNARFLFEEKYKMTNKPYFCKEITNIIKGIALIMMFIHHFFTFPPWWGDVIDYPIIRELSPYFFEPFKMCVLIFCFLTGYTYFFNGQKNLKYSLRKITDIFIPYWFVFFVFAVIAVLCGYKYSASGFVKELFALQCPTMYFCWYVAFYWATMLIIPFIAKVMAKTKNIHADILLSALIVPYIIRAIRYFLPENTIVNDLLSNLICYFPTVLIGFVFAKYGLFEKLYNSVSKTFTGRIGRIAVLVLLFIASPMGRWYPRSFFIYFEELPVIHKPLPFLINLDILFTPLFIFAAVNLCREIKAVFIKKGLIKIGKYSLLMWFVSCIFFNNSKQVFRPILYFPRNPVLVLLWGLILCMAVSVILNFVVSRLTDWKNKLLFSGK